MIRIGRWPPPVPFAQVETHWRMWLRAPQACLPPGNFSDALSRGFGPEHVIAIGGGNQELGVQRTADLFGVDRRSVFAVNGNSGSDGKYVDC